MNAVRANSLLWEKGAACTPGGTGVKYVTNKLINQITPAIKGISNMILAMPLLDFIIVGPLGPVSITLNLLLSE